MKYHLYLAKCGKLEFFVRAFNREIARAKAIVDLYNRGYSTRGLRLYYQQEL